MLKKSNKNPSKIFVEVLFTLIVAYILSLIVSIVLYFAFITLNIDKAAEHSTYVNFASGVVFGLAVGYKLKEIFSRK